MAEKVIYKLTTPSGDPVRVEEAWKDANGELLTEKVNKADAQTITGLKTFSTLPQSSATPSDDKDLATKKYSDDLWATRKAQEEKCYQALKTVTEDFTRTDPVYVRIGEDGEPEIHYTMTQADGSSYFANMDLGDATIYVRNGAVCTTFDNCFNRATAKAVVIDSTANAISLIGVFRMFNGSDLSKTTIDGTNATSIYAICDEMSGVTLPPNFTNTRNVKSGGQLFGWSSGLTYVPEIDLSSVENLIYAFNSLTNITAFHATGMSVSFDIHWSTKLTRAALLEVFNNLADLTGKTSATLTIGATLGAKITDEDRAIVTGKNWNLAE